MYLYLIRHGQSEANKQNIIQGQRNYPLSEVGKHQAKLLAQFMKKVKLDALYSSDLARALETAKQIEKTIKIPVQPSPLFREIKLGPFEGKTKEEIYAKYPQVKERTLLTSGVKGTETVEEITARLEKIIAKMKELGEEERVAVVTHGGVISLLLMYLLLGKDWHRYHRPFRIENTGITLIQLSKHNKPLIHYVNQTTHLAKESP